MNTLDLIALFPFVFYSVIGFKKGLLKSIFGLLGFILGIIICLKFGQVVLSLVEAKNLDSPILPFIVYFLLFISAIVLSHYLGVLIEKILKTVQLNGINRLFGLLFGAFKALMIISLFFWLIDSANFLDDEVKTNSFSFELINRLSPVMLEYISDALPFLENLISEVEKYFLNINQLDLPSR